jgi:hypothetical protein
MRSGSRPVLVAEVETFSNSSGEYRGALRRLLLRGRFVTAQTTECYATGRCRFAVVVVDVGRGGDVASTDEDTLGRVVTLVASGRGEAAFLAYDADHGNFVIEKIDDFGVSERDRGPALHDLELHGRRIEWLNGDKRRSEPIAHVRRCGPESVGSTEIGRSARVYSVDPPGDAEGRETEHYGCLFSGGSSLLLGSDELGSSAYSYLADFQIAGRFVGWYEYGCLGECSVTLHVADLRARTIRDGRGHAPGTFFLNRRGFAADIAQRGWREPYDLYAFDTSGERLIDSGDDIDPASVVLTADAITWRHGAEERREELR